jgi:hypothetical protein
VAELNGCRVAAVLTADTYMKVRVSRSAELKSHLHKLADTCLVKLSEWIVLKNLGVVVSI